jgi:hypothetical protein
MARSGAFASTQQALGASEAAGEALAAKTGCPDQSAQRLRHLAVEKLVTKFPLVAIPGLIDGNVLGDSIGIALAAGRFASESSVIQSRHQLMDALPTPEPIPH